MKKLGQFGIILSILVIGDIVQTAFKLPIPSTIIGIILLLSLLLFKVIKLQWVDEISEILLDNLSLLFIPAGVAIMNEFQMFRGNFLSVICIIVTTTMIVMLVTGYVVQALMNMHKDRRKI